MIRVLCRAGIGGLSHYCHSAVTIILILGLVPVRVVRLMAGLLLIYSPAQLSEGLAGTL